MKCPQIALGASPTLGLSDLFQTFEDLESVVDKEAEIASIRELLGKDDAQQNDEKEPLC